VVGGCADPGRDARCGDSISLPENRAGLPYQIPPFLGVGAAGPQQGASLPGKRLLRTKAPAALLL